VVDLEERVGLEGIVYAGNHGIEIRGHGLHFVEPIAFLLEPALKKVLADLSERVAGIPNARIEDKRLTATLNLRHVRPEHRIRAGEIALELVGEASQFQCRAAKDAFDILPRNGWHKGRAVEWIRHHLGMSESLVIFAGDDVSDEDAFAALAGAITIKVGELPTSAAYRAESPSEIWALLTQLETALAR
jgi:trehalose-phosphatase